ncbi:MazG nucleotide pyrophosphohydrolase domain-containing protein [Nocardioides acrostichi]|uniref:Nucleoside triphosphate pyrophosphohydrolase n=1 Tax=Nocardioides acrostichi TaxID=2784339 RepID=A0A930Y700_9ACTN|nr:MazG nucleotide pyrophosphohydrolase domain-containing protein [Nocardioides acrostichi]MBF4162905.1 nucleoside triphosphate pyrophosphohydrolase [Nocardioides acrostichi]
MHDADPEPLLVFRAVMARLRAECPWKREQTHRSLARYLLEETYETLEVLDVEPPDDAHLAEELGDLLLQVYFHAALAAERGAFDLDDVARGIIAKMVRRNPHVFGEERSGEGPGDEERTAAAVNDRWQRIKAEEKADRAELDDGLPSALPALLYADKLLDRLERSGRRVGVDEGSADVGERLLALVVEARVGGVDAEQALRAAVRRRL